MFFGSRMGPKSFEWSAKVAEAASALAFSELVHAIMEPPNDHESGDAQ